MLQKFGPFNFRQKSCRSKEKFNAKILCPVLESPVLPLSQRLEPLPEEKKLKLTLASQISSLISSVITLSSLASPLFPSLSLALSSRTQPHPSPSRRLTFHPYVIPTQYRTCIEVDCDLVKTKR